MGANTEIIFPPFCLDPHNEQLWREEQLIALRPKTFAILRHLAEHPGRLVRKDELVRAVWGDTQVSEEGLRDYLREIRQALGDDAAAPRFIETVRGRGYRFLPTISTQPAPGSRFQVPKVQGRETGPRLGTLNLECGTPLIGRESELAQLEGWLGKAVSGERQIVFVTGEPGIGKTALVEAFLAHVGEQGPTPREGVGWVGRGQCIETHGAGEAFLPILEALGRRAQGPGGPILIATLRQHAPMWLVQLPAFVEAEELATLQRKVQGASRGRMLRELAEALEVLTVKQFLILVLEDLHWSDVSTLDLLAFLARRKEPARLLVIGTYRPVEMLSERHPLKGVVQELYAHGLAAELSLGLLSDVDIEAYLEKRLDVGARRAAPLPALARTLHHRTGGNPLFLVSLVHELIERGVLVQADAGWEFKEEAAVIANSVPGSIRYLVARQSERLSAEARRTLEAASVAGVEFSAAAVAAALATDTATVERQCEQLAERQQFLRRLGVEEWPDGTLAARYGFLHALYQQLWHERVTPTQLQHDHLQIGQRKERAYGERVREIAAELALHFEQARDYSRAVYYLHQASKTALRRLANQEAIHLITKGLSLLQLLPKTLERNQQELSLQFTLGAPLMVIKGYTAPELETVLTRIQELSQQVQDTRQLFQIVYILAIFYVGRAAFHTARELVVQLFTLAQRTHDALTHLRSRFAMSSTLLFRGEFVEARAHAEQGFRLYERCRGDRSMWEVHHNGLGCLNCLAWSLWMLGYPDQALSRTQEALTTAQTQALPSTLAETVSYAAWLAHIHRDWQTAEDHAAALLTLCTTHGFSLLQTEAAIIQGWAWAEQGREEGFAQIRRGLADYCAKRAEIMLPRSLALLATVYEKRGRAEEGLKLVVEALVRVDKTEGRLGEAELYRLKGELTLQSKVESEKGKEESQKSNGKSQRAKIPSPRRLTPGAQTEAAAEAEGCFLKAIEIAKTQQAKMWELRATVSLARLWQRQGKREKAWQILADIYDWFTEGFDTVDLKEARALLEELSEQDHGRLTL